MSSLAAPALFAGLFDDAAVFPPGLAPVPDAVREHRVHRAAWYRDMIGPLLVPVAQLVDFTDVLSRDAATRDAETPGAAAPGPQGAGAATDEPPLRIALIGDGSQHDPLPGLLGAVTTLRDPEARVPVHVVGVELALPREGDQVRAVERVTAALDRFLPDDVPAWVEVHRRPGLADALAALAQAPDRVRAKFRTGGVEAALFPSPDELATVLHQAHAVGVPLKLTAGLHHAVRHTGETTGFLHHGFANVLAAVARADAGAPAEELAEILSEQDAAPLVTALSSLTDAQAVAVRSTFASFGCCGVTDPVDDLVALRLIEQA